MRWGGVGGGCMPLKSQNNVSNLFALFQEKAMIFVKRSQKNESRGKSHPFIAQNIEANDICPPLTHTLISSAENKLWLVILNQLNAVAVLPVKYI